MSPTLAPRHISVVPRTTLLLTALLAACGNVSEAPDGGEPAGMAGAGGSVAGTTGSAGTTGDVGAGGGGVAGAPAGSGGAPIAGTTGAAGATGGGTTGNAGATGVGGASGSGGTGVQRPPYVETKNTSAGQPAITVTVRIANNDAAPLALARVTLRYWYTADATPPVAQTPICYSSTSGGCGTMEPISFKSIPPRPSGAADYYAEIRFRPEAGYLAPSGGSYVEILIGWSKNDGSAFNQTNDWSGYQSNSFTGNTQVTAYVDGQLITGIEPPL